MQHARPPAAPQGTWRRLQQCGLGRLCLAAAMTLLIATAHVREGRAASYCPITVSYEVSLGQAPLTVANASSGSPANFADIPIFFAKIGVFSNNVRRGSSCACQPCSLQPSRMRISEAAPAREST